MTQEMIDRLPMMIEEMKSSSIKLAQINSSVYELLSTTRLDDNNCLQISLYDRTSENLYRSSALLDEAISYLEELLAMRKEAEENGRR